MNHFSFLTLITFLALLPSCLSTSKPCAIGLLKYFPGPFFDSNSDPDHSRAVAHFERAFPLSLWVQNEDSLNRIVLKKLGWEQKTLSNADLHVELFPNGVMVKVK